MKDRLSAHEWDDAIDVFERRDSRPPDGWMRTADPEVAAAKAAFFVKHPWTAFRARLDERLERTQLRRKLQLNLWLSGLGLAASAAIVLLLVMPRDALVEHRGERHSGVRSKGAVGVTTPAATVAPRLRMMRGDKVVTEGDVLHPGDEIRFSIDTGSYDHVLVFGIESGGAMTPYYPEQTAGVSLTVGMGRGLTLPDAVVLVDHVGAERIVAVFSTQALSWTVVHDVAQRLLQQSGNDLRLMPELGLIDTAEASLWFEKQSLR